MDKNRRWQRYYFDEYGTMYTGSYIFLENECILELGKLDCLIRDKQGVILIIFL